MKYVIGIDIGGTNTDCVLVGVDGNIYKKEKLSTTKNLEDAVKNAVVAVAVGISPSDILRICLGTTFATNAILEAKELEKVGIIRIAGQRPAVPSGYGWPKHLQEKIVAQTITIDGGFRCDATSLTSFCEKQAIEAVEGLLQQGAQAIALVGVYASLQDGEEKYIAEYIEKTFPDLFFSSSSKIGGIGFLQRETATIFNAALKKAMKRGFSRLENAMQELDIVAPFYMVKNDGSVMSMKEAMKNPIFTVAAGLTNSFSGAASLAKMSQAIVIDIGGTSTDIGLVVDGAAKRSCHEASIGGISLQFPMPDAISLPLGGGTIVRITEDSYTIGPDSVGARLAQEAISFGGSTLTVTDIALKCGKLSILGSCPHAVDLPESVATKIMQDIEMMILKAALMMKGKEKDLPILLCGGGAPIGMQKGMQLVHDAGFANAYGAALATISHTVDVTMSLLNRQEVLESIKKQALDGVIEKGAQPSTVEIAHVEISPYAYSREALARIIVTGRGVFA